MHAAYTDDEREDLMTATIRGRCAHLDYIDQPAEPDVGIALPYAECQDCGATTADWIDDYEDDRHAVYPVWDDSYDPEDVWCVADDCTAELVNECDECDDYHCDLHPHS